MSARAIVNRDDAVHSAVDGLLRPLPLGDVVIDHAANRVHAFAHPLRIAERRDEEPHTLLERDVDVFHHALEVDLRRRLDERVEADRLRREPPDEPQSLAIFVAVDVRERDRLHDADAARFAHRGDELRIAAWIHRPADERHLDAGLPEEGVLRDDIHRVARCGMGAASFAGTGPSFQRTVARAMRSPFWSVISEMKSYSPSTVRSGRFGRLSAVTVPRAFLKYSMDGHGGEPAE